MNYVSSRSDEYMTRRPF